MIFTLIICFKLVSAFGERIKVKELSWQKDERWHELMSFMVKELFQGPNPTDKLLEDATSEALDEPDWALNLDICDMVNHEKVNSVELIHGKLIDDPQTVVNNRNKALILIEAWGESTSELRYLPVFEETYKDLACTLNMQCNVAVKDSFSVAWVFAFPGRDNESLAPIFTPARSVSAAEVDASLAQQLQRNCIELLSTVLSSSPQQMLLRSLRSFSYLFMICIRQSHLKACSYACLLFEALNVNDEIQKALSKYEELKKPSVMDDLDEMIFGKKGGVHLKGADLKKQQASKDDLITF
ncbi:hypothetical protein ERO13_A13G156450v2 [Gossypium hirsutum]|nr:hypothetical protein ERO13_A13G156450v2 [Gossypium hirsutum]